MSLFFCPSGLLARELVHVSVYGTLVGIHSEKLALLSDLTNEEHMTKMNLLFVTVLLLIVQSFYLLTKYYVAPSPLEAEAFSNL